MACFSSRIDHLQRQCLALVGVHVACLSFLSAGGSFSSFGWERRLFCAEIAPKHGRSGSGSTKIPQERIGSFPFTTRRMHERLELEGFPRGFLTAFSKAQPRSFGSNLDSFVSLNVYHHQRLWACVHSCLAACLRTGFCSGWICSLYSKPSLAGWEINNQATIYGILTGCKAVV